MHRMCENMIVTHGFDVRAKFSTQGVLGRSETGRAFWRSLQRSVPMAFWVGPKR